MWRLLYFIYALIVVSCTTISSNNLSQSSGMGAWGGGSSGRSGYSSSGSHK